MIPLHFKLRRLRWIILPAIFLLAILYQLTLGALISPLPTHLHWWAELLVSSVLGSLLAWLGISWIAAAAGRQAEAEAQLRAAYQELEASHQKLLALQELGQRVANARDRQAVLELAARAPLQLAGANASTVVSFDEQNNRLTLDMAWGLSDAYLRALRARIEAGIAAERCRSCATLKTGLSGDCPLFDGLQSVARAEGIGSLFCLPIVSEQERISVVSAYFPSADGPPEDQIRLLNILGRVIAAALESLRTRERQIATLHALDQAAQIDPATTPVGQAIEDLATQVLDIAVAGWEAQAGGLFLYDEARGAWNCHAQHGLGESPQDARYRFALELASQAYERAAPVILVDLQQDAGHKLRSAAAAPLSTEGNTLGAIFLGASRRRAINQRHAELLATMAHQIALAIRNAQLYQCVNQMAVLEERYRLAREIHDGLAQTLAYLNMQTERLEGLIADQQAEAATRALAEIRQSIRGAYVDAREAIDGLRLSVEEPHQLAARLQDYVADYSQQSGLEVRFVAQPENLTAEPTTALQLLRIAQEALTNVRKHARAQHVDVRLVASAKELELTILDDGDGFPAALQADRPHRGYGLTIMRERAESLGGTLSVATGPGQGTCITAVIPLGDR